MFQPELRGRPLIVLSNNDGCAIARSDEAKALGVKMGQALHLIDPAVRRQLAVRSANFTLYGDISARIGAILRDAVPRIEAYSIDESFLDLQGVLDLTRFAFRSAGARAALDRHPQLRWDRSDEDLGQAGEPCRQVCHPQAGELSGEPRRCGQSG